MDQSKASSAPGVTSVTMLGTLPPLRGLSSYCLELASAMADLVRVEFISFKKLYPGFLYPGGRLKEDHSFPEVNHRQLKISRRLTWYNPLSWIREALSTRTDLLHAQWSLPLLLIYACIGAVFKLRGKPVVFTVHNVLDHENSRFFKAASRRLFKLGDHFIVHTQEGRRQMQAHYAIPADRISVVAHGSLDFHVKPQANRDNIRRQLDINSRDKAVLLFGAVRPYKGLDIALQAFSRVILEVPDSVLIIAGKLWQNWEPYQKRIDQYGIANEVKTFLNYIPSSDVFRYYEAADLVILPYLQFSSQSGVGTTAVAFRKPMIVTSVGGLPDLVKNTEYIVPPGDADILAGKMIDCLSDPDRLATMADDAAQVAAEISWPAIAQKTLAIYQQLRSPD